MAVSVSIISTDVKGSERHVLADVTFDSSYSIGGEAVTAANFGLTVLKNVVPGPAVDPDTADNALVCAFDRTNVKLLLFYGDNNNAADGPLIEFPDTTTGAAFTSRVEAVGY